ncbi:MAG: enoyl-CoA hydratase-related protein, partial [Bacteroidota bacterium]
PVEEAEKYGLVSQTVTASEMEEAVTSVIDELKSNSPSAISLGLQAYDQIQPSAQAHKYLREMLMKTIATQDGQEGLKAFREKRKPEWKGQ